MSPASKLKLGSGLVCIILPRSIAIIEAPVFVLNLRFSIDLPSTGDSSLIVKSSIVRLERSVYLSKNGFCFAVLVSFGLAGFVMKKFLNSSYIWPAVATAVLSFTSMSIAGNIGLVERLAENWPASFHAKAVYSVLPVQLVAFGTLGSVIGFWMAVRYNYWRKYKSVSS